MSASIPKPTVGESAGCLTVRLPATEESPEESTARFILMTTESCLETLHSGKLLNPVAHEPQYANSGENYPEF